VSASKTFRLVLIKPSRYDDAGYVVQWFWSWIPLNKRNLLKHPIMSKEEWEGANHDAWGQYHTLDHIETLMRRSAACGMSVGNMMLIVLWTFSNSSV